MLIVRTKQLLINLAKTANRRKLQQTFLRGQVSNNKFLFSSAKWNKINFLKKLDKQIIDSQGLIIYEDADSEAYFKNKHWNISYIQQKTMFQYSKEEGNHEIRVLTYVKYDPPNDPERSQDANAEEQDQKKRLNYAQVGIYIRKKGEKKWLTAEMAVLQGSIELTGVFFTNQEPNFSWEKNTYPGPQLQSLPIEIVNGMNVFFTELGLTSEVIMNMVIHASIKVDPLDLQWLKNLKQIWS